MSRATKALVESRAKIAAKLVLGGMPPKQIAYEIGSSPTHVHKVLEQGGVVHRWLTVAEYQAVLAARKAA